jgi:2-C-methyl-D-erythritol 2,4-cyclodiphosphate synthase
MNRIGFGYDSHRFEAGRPLVLAGVKLPGERGLAGHSDGDAALHALMDAMLGAAGLGDVGEHFPPTDERFRNADSAALCTEVVALLAQMGWVVVNADLTIVTEEPHLAPHKQAMRDRVGDLLGLDTVAVSVKAKTNEKMDAIGAGEGLAAYAVVLLEELGE